MTKEISLHDLEKILAREYAEGKASVESGKKLKKRIGDLGYKQEERGSARLDVLRRITNRVEQLSGETLSIGREEEHKSN